MRLKDAAQATRTLSGGFPFRKTQTKNEALLVFEGDLLKGHKIIGEGDVIDASNRHVILRMITELKNKLQPGSRFIGDKDEKPVDE